MRPPNRTWKRTTAPTVEPVTLAEAKAHLKVDVDDDDALIAIYIAAAREACEVWAGRSFLSQTWTLYLDRFPGQTINAPGPETAWAGQYQNEGIIELPMGPVVSVTGISYLDSDGAPTVLNASLYRTDLVSDPGRIAPAYGQSWPATRDEINAVSIVYTTGYGAAGTDVPAQARAAVLLLLGTLYENREQAVVGTIVASLPLGVMDLLASIRIPTIP